MTSKKIFIGMEIKDVYGSLLDRQIDDLDSNIWSRTPYEDLHLTVFFIGKVEEDIIPSIEEIIQNVSSRTRPISFMGGRTMIMKPDEPTMIWLKFEKNKYFESLSDEFENYFKKIGTWELNRQKAYNKNNHKPIPHVTLGRVRGGGMLDSLLPPFELGPKLDSFTTYELVLYESIFDTVAKTRSYKLLNKWNLREN